MKTRGSQSNLDIKSYLQRHINLSPLRKLFFEFIKVELVDRIVFGEVLIVGKKRMLSFNKSLRNIDQPTDVLSLYMPIPESGPILLGSIMLCPDMINPKEMPGKNPLLYLLAHGLYHTIGYEHRNDAEEERMHNAVLNILKKI